MDIAEMLVVWETQGVWLFASDRVFGVFWDLLKETCGWSFNDFKGEFIVVEVGKELIRAHFDDRFLR